MIQSTLEDASTDLDIEIVKKPVIPQQRSSIEDLMDHIDNNALPADPKTRLCLGEHEHIRVKHGDRIQKKNCIKQSAKARKFGKKPELPEALHRRLFSDDTGPLSLYDGFKLNRRERAQKKLLKKARSTGRLVGELQTA